MDNSSSQSNSATIRPWDFLVVAINLAGGTIETNLQNVQQCDLFQYINDQRELDENFIDSLPEVIQDWTLAFSDASRKLEQELGLRKAQRKRQLEESLDSLKQSHAGNDNINWGEHHDDNDLDNSVEKVLVKTADVVKDKDGEDLQLAVSRQKWNDRQDPSEQFRRMASPKNFERFMGSSMCFKKDVISADLAFIAEENTMNSIIDVGRSFSIADFDGSEKVKPAAIVAARAKKLQALPVMLNKQCLDMFIGEEAWNPEKLSLSSFVSADTHWGSAEATSLAVTNFLALGQHIYGDSFQALAPLLKGVVENEEIITDCVEAPLFPAALIQSKLIKLFNHLRHPVFNDDGTLYVMKNGGWVKIWKVLMSDVRINANAVCVFQTMKLPMMPEIFRLGHIVNETGKRSTSDVHEGQSLGKCVGNVAGFVGFDEWPVCSRGKSCRFSHSDPTAKDCDQIVSAIQRIGNRPAELKNRFISMVKARLHGETNV